MKHLTVKVDTNGTTDEVEVQQAVKAIQDGYGDTINTTYAKISGTFPNMTVGYAARAGADGDGNSITETYVNKSDFLNVLFPVGAYYITESTTSSPASLFGGEWVQVNGKFLLGQSVQDGLLPGAEGGEKTHTLTLQEMPQHSHKPHQFTWILSYGANTGQNVISGGSKGNANIFNVDADQNRYTGTAGGNAAHNNMPPYRIVFIWRRTA